MSALIITGLLLAVLALASRLHELRQKFSQVKHERDVYAHLYEDFITADYVAAGGRLPKNWVRNLHETDER